MPGIDGLLDYLQTLTPGPVSDTSLLERLLMESWGEFSGSEAEKMAGFKLSGRMEDAEWRPPVVRFRIERHGGTVMGSTRAERHEWNIDINARTATCMNVGHRQISPMAPRLDVRPIAEEMVNLILQRKSDERLKWKDDGSVQVQIGKILPEGSAATQTLVARRKRFRQAVEALLGEAGWTCIRPNVYQPPAS